MATPRDRGNQHFSAGEYVEAAQCYTEGLEQTRGLPCQSRDQVALRPTLLANRAACYLKLGQLAKAAADCRECLKHDPCHAKAHFRLAKALPPDDEAAGPAIAAAYALWDAAGRSSDITETYEAIQRATATARSRKAAPHAVALLDLPTDPSRKVATASSWTEVSDAVNRGVELVVLKPGTYTTTTVPPVPRYGSGASSYTLLGLGDVHLKPSFMGSHAIWLPDRTLHVTLVNMRLEGNGRCAAACSSGSGTQLTMVHCRVEDYGEVGLLVTDEASARLYGCTFTRTAGQAVEVRQGSEVIACRTTMTECRQGVCAYGGAKSVTLYDCVVQDSKREGVLLTGTYTNTATELQNVMEDPRKANRSASAARATEEAEAWGKARGTQLQAEMVRCTIRGSREFGVSVDMGASLVARCCRFERNDPYCIFVKGTSDAAIMGCQVIFTGGQSQSDWLARSGLPMAQRRQSGVQVGFNYGGTVRVVGCALVGPEELAVVEELRRSGDALVLPGSLRRMGIWSKPVVEERNSYHELSGAGGRGAGAGQGGGRKREGGKAARGVGLGLGGGAREAAQLEALLFPTVEELAARLPHWLNLEQGGDDVAGGSCSRSRAQDGGGGGGGLYATGPAAAARRQLPPAALLQRTGHTFPQAAWAPTAHEFYAIGNTMGADVTASSGADGAAGAPLRILLAACGDIRNALATVHGVMGRHTAASAPVPFPAAFPSPVLHLVLNDGNLAMLARNAVLLHLAVAAAEAAGMDWDVGMVGAADGLGEQLTGAEEVLEVWASHGLMPYTAQLLEATLRALAYGPWPAWLRAAWSLDEQGRDGGHSRVAAEAQGAAAGGSGDSAEAALRGAIQAWAECGMSLGDVLEQREERLGGGLSAVAAVARERAVQLSLEAVEGSAGRAVAAQVRGEVEQYVRSGSLKRADGPGGSVGPGAGAAAGEALSLNPTFLSAPELQYTAYFSSSIFRAVPLGAGTSAWSRLLATLRPQLAATAAALRSGAATVTLVPGDVLAVMTTAPSTTGSTTTASSSSSGSDCGSCSAAAAPPQFDVIDCSNVADYVSLQALAAAAAPLLLPLRHARLRAESILGYSAWLAQQPAASKGTGPGAAAKGSPAAHAAAASEFAGSQLTVSLGAFEQVLGLELRGGQPVAGNANALRLEWAPAAPPASPPCTCSPTPLAPTSTNVTTRPASSWMTPTRLLLELLPAAKRLLDPPPPATSAAPAGGPPLALLHLAHLALGPRHTDSFIRTFLRCEPSGLAQLFKWELTLHAQLQAAGRTAPVVVRRVLYDAQPGVALMAVSSVPLVLAFSKEGLARGSEVVVGGGAGGSVVKQLMCAFAWDEEHAVAHVLLPAGIVEQCGTWHVTLCAVGGAGQGTGKGQGAGTLVVVGRSVMVRELKEVAGAGGRQEGASAGVGGGGAPVRWRLHPRGAAFEGVVGLGVLDQVGQPGSAGGGDAGGGKAPSGLAGGAGQWRGEVTVERGAKGVPRWVTVDVAAPGPLPAAEEAAVSVAVEEGGVLVVRVTGKGGGKARAGEREQVFGVPLPEGQVYGKAEGVKMSRKLGLLSARVGVVG